MPAYGNPFLQQRPRRIDAGTRNDMLQFGTGPRTGRTGIPMAGSFGGLNEFYALQDRSRPAFADPRTPFGFGPSAQEEGRRSTQAGLIYNPYMGGYLPDTMYTRTMGSRGMGTVPNVQPQPPQMTDQQMEWARKAQAGKSGSDVLGKMGEKMAGFSRPPGMLGSAFSVAQTAANAVSSRVPEFSFSQGGNPYANTRAQNFQNMLDAGGDFAQIRQDYNREAAGTGYSMGDGRTMGRISYNPYANTLGREQLQGQIDAKRAAEMAARGEGAVQRFNAQGAQANISPEMERGGFRQTSGSAFKVNPYGTATATFGERKGPGMVKDELTGKMVPISQAVADMKAVQATKGINPETGAPLDEKETKKAQEGFLASRGIEGKKKNSLRNNGAHSESKNSSKKEMDSIFGYPIKSPSDLGLDEWMKTNTNVAGMAWGGGLNDSSPEEERVIVSNPHNKTQATPSQRLGLYMIEAARHYMEEQQYNPKFSLTEEQKKWQKSLGGKYASDDTSFKKSLVSRIIGGDFVPGVTDEQKAEAKSMLEKLQKRTMGASK